MSLVRITQPTIEPVDLDELKDHARVTSDAEVLLMMAYIGAARQLAEEYTERAFIWQRWRQSYDVMFPAIIRLHRSPLIVDTGSPSSPEITYYDSTGALAAYSNTGFIVNADSDPPTIRPGYDTVWPVTRTYLGTVLTVTYAAGYGTQPQDVPEPIRQAIRMLAAYYFNQREAITPERLEDAPMAVKALLNPYRSRWMFAA